MSRADVMRPNATGERAYDADAMLDGRGAIRRGDAIDGKSGRLAARMTCGRK